MNQIGLGFKLVEKTEKQIILNLYKISNQWVSPLFYSFLIYFLF